MVPGPCGPRAGARAPLCNLPSNQAGPLSLHFFSLILQRSSAGSRHYPAVQYAPAHASNLPRSTIFRLKTSALPCSNKFPGPCARWARGGGRDGVKCRPGCLAAILTRKRKRCCIRSEFHQVGWLQAGERRAPCVGWLQTGATP